MFKFKNTLLIQVGELAVHPQKQAWRTNSEDHPGVDQGRFQHTDWTVFMHTDICACSVMDYTATIINGATTEKRIITLPTAPVHHWTVLHTHTYTCLYSTMHQYALV